MNRKYIHKELTDSTNNDICRLAAEGALEGQVVTADVQTAGKGRRGRSWDAEAKTSLLFSLLLRPTIAPDSAPQITLLMAMAVVEAIYGLTGLEAKIKWPNDVVVNHKKICGILTQMQLKDGGIDYVVVGTGVNVNRKHIPAELESMATSLWLEKSKERKGKKGSGLNTEISDEVFEIEREVLLEHILDAFERYYELFLEKRDLSEIMTQYNEKLVSLNKEVKVLDPKGEFTGISKGINEKGELLVELPNSEVRAIYAGEVSVRGLYGYV